MTPKMGTGREKWAARRPWALLPASSCHVGPGLWRESAGFGGIQGAQHTARAGLLRGLEVSGRPGDVLDRPEKTWVRGFTRGFIFE